MSGFPVSKGYTALQKTVHWIVVGLIISQIITHEGIEAASEAYQSGGVPGTFDGILATLHIWLGLSVLFFAAFRLYLRWRFGAPPLPETSSSLQNRVAKVVHVAIYILLFLVPMSGAAAVWINPAAGDAHEVLKNALIAAIILHVIGALHHHFIAKDDVLRRMLKSPSP